MRKYITILVLALCTGFFCCSTSSDKSKDSVPDPFRKFIKKFKPLHLPSTFRTSLGAQASASSPTFEELNGLPEYDGKSNDTLFMKDFGPQTVYYVAADRLEREDQGGNRLRRRARGRRSRLAAQQPLRSGAPHQRERARAAHARRPHLRALHHQQAA